MGCGCTRLGAGVSANERLRTTVPRLATGTGVGAVVRMLVRS